MNLIFIYGPPAAGKLTVATALAGLTDYPVFHNHMTSGILAPLFPYGDKRLNAVRSRLGKEIRLRIFEEAAIAGVSFTTTFGAAGPRYFKFFRDVQRVVGEAGGNVLFVQLTADHATLMERVVEQSRVDHGKIDSPEFLAQKLADEPDTFSKFPDLEHLSINNSRLQPAEVAQTIKEYYQL